MLSFNDMPAFLRSSLILSLNSKFLSFLALSLNSIKISTTDLILLSSIFDLFFSKPNTSKTNALSFFAPGRWNEVSDRRPTFPLLSPKRNWPQHLLGPNPRGIGIVPAARGAHQSVGHGAFFCPARPPHAASLSLIHI